MDSFVIRARSRRKVQKLPKPNTEKSYRYRKSGSTIHRCERHTTGFRRRRGCTLRDHHSLHNYEAFQSFANYLAACAKSNPDLRPVLGPKSQETSNAAKLYLDRCRAIGQKSSSIGSGTKFCAAKKPPTLKALLTLKTMDVAKADVRPNRWGNYRPTKVSLR